MTDLVLGKGRLYFEKFLTGTKTRNGQGFAYFGNTPELTTTVDEDKLEHYSSEGGLNVKDASVITQSTTSGAFTTDHISPENLALWYRGETAPVTQLAGADVEDTWESVKLGNYFQLGETNDQIQGARNVSGLAATKGNASAAGTLTFSTVPPVEGDDVTINGVQYNFTAAPVETTDVLIGATLAESAANLRDAVNAYNDPLVTATAAAAVTTIHARYAGTNGNAITLAKSFATAGNMTLSAATLAGGTDTVVAMDGNFTVNLATGLVRALPTAPDVSDGDAVVFTYDQAATALTTVVAGNQAIEGRMLFVSDNAYGPNKDHLWPDVLLSADGDYSLIGDEWQQISFNYEVLKLDDDTPREIITDRG